MECCIPIKLSDGYERLKVKVRNNLRRMAAPFESSFLSEREHIIGQLERGTVITKFYGKKVRQPELYHTSRAYLAFKQCSTAGFKSHVPVNN